MESAKAGGEIIKIVLVVIAFGIGAYLAKKEMKKKKMTESERKKYEKKRGEFNKKITIVLGVVLLVILGIFGLMLFLWS